MSALGVALRQAFISPAPWLSWLSLTLALGVLAPFGTDVSCTPLQRLYCFAAPVGLALLWGVTARVLVQHCCPRLGYWEAALAVIAVSCVLLPGPLVWLTPHITLIPRQDLPGYGEAALLTAVLGIGAAAVRWSLTPGAREAGREAAAESGPKVPRLVERLSPELRGRVLRVRGRNHYVEVLTERGEARILLRLSDAIAELDGSDGLQVHRSHWVAAAAVVGSQKVGPKHELLLKDGSRVPVSRNYVEAVAARGLL
ncbi:MAG: LytTR family transcriptional regulator [Rhodobacteraceae bacterium]|nr:LytTR family transcriptional regulator [Paracoccaceae bacterium]